MNQYFHNVLCGYTKFWCLQIWTTTLMAHHVILVRKLCKMTSWRQFSLKDIWHQASYKILFVRIRTTIMLGSMCLQRTGSPLYWIMLLSKCMSFNNGHAVSADKVDDRDKLSWTLFLTLFWFFQRFILYGNGHVSLFIVVIYNTLSHIAVKSTNH